jgi:hypothetical protein
VPPGEYERIVHRDYDVIAEARVEAADLGISVLDQHPAAPAAVVMR